ILYAGNASHAIMLIGAPFAPAVQPAALRHQAVEGAKISGFSIQAGVVTTGIGSFGTVSLLSFHCAFPLLSGLHGESQSDRPQAHCLFPFGACCLLRTLVRPEGAFLAPS